MKAGKLSESILKRSVLRQLHNSAVRAPGVGIDFGAVDASAGKQIVTAEACRAFDTWGKNIGDYDDASAPDICKRK